MIQAPGIISRKKKRLIKLALDISVKDSALVQVVHALKDLKIASFFGYVGLSSMIDACDKESLVRLCSVHRLGDSQGWCLISSGCQIVWYF